MPNSESSSGLDPVRLIPEFVPDESKETVEIPVQIENGTVKLNIESPDEAENSLPDLRDGAVGTLTVPALALENEEDYERLTAELSEIIVPTTIRVWFRIRTDHRETEQIAENVKEYLYQTALPNVGRGYQLIPIRLREHLWLRHRGTKNPEFHSCRCALPEPLRGETGEDEPPSSLNQAYTRLSEIFETHRSTHTGNVFEKGHVRIPPHEAWKRLNDFRLRSPKECVWQADGPWLRPWWIRREPKRSQTGSQQSLLVNEESGVEHWATFDAEVDNNEWRATPRYVEVENGDETRGEEKQKPLQDLLSEFQKNGYRPFDPVLDDPSPPAPLN